MVDAHVTAATVDGDLDGDAFALPPPLTTLPRPGPADSAGATSFASGLLPWVCVASNSPAAAAWTCPVCPCQHAHSLEGAACSRLCAQMSLCLPAVVDAVYVFAVADAILCVACLVGRPSRTRIESSRGAGMAVACRAEGMAALGIAVHIVWWRLVLYEMERRRRRSVAP